MKKNKFTKCSKILLASVLLLPVMNLKSIPVHAQTQTTVATNQRVTTESVTKEQAIKDGQKLTSSQLRSMSQYIRIVNNQYVLQVPEDSGIPKSAVQAEQEVLTVFNRMVKENGAVLISDDSGEDEVSDFPFVSFARRSRKSHKRHKIEIVGYGSNGYCYRDSHGRFHYRVTKNIGQATWDTIVYGWGTTDVG